MQKAGFLMARFISWCAWCKQSVQKYLDRRTNGPVNSAKYKYEKQVSPLTLLLVKVNTRGSKIIKNNGHIHVYSSWAGADNPLDSFVFFQKHKYCVYLVICCNYLPINDFITVFLFQTDSQPKLTCSKIGQGQPRVIIYTNFVEFDSSMLHAKFEDHMTFGSGDFSMF